MAGKHEANSVGKRAAGGGNGKFVLLGLLAVALAAYVGLCAWVNGSGTTLPNVSIGGLGVSGMTKQEIRFAVDRALETMADDAVVTLHYGDWSGTIRGDQMLNNPQPDLHGANSIDAALAVGRTGNFFTYGFQFLRNLFGGTDIPLDLALAVTPQDALHDLIDQAKAAVDDDEDVGKAVYRMDGEQLLVTKGVTQIAVDRDATEWAVYEAMEEQIFPALFGGEETMNVDIELPLVEFKPEELSATAVYNEIHTEVAEPTYNKETGEVTDHTVGIDFDVDALKAAYEAAGEGETFSIPLAVTQPKDTKQAYEAKLFADVLGTGTTNVSGSANRKSNVKLSAAACNGVILMPGEIFAYNETTGSRTADKGYLPAPTYNAGASVDDVGGGICQTSSTIYYAVLHTTLEVVERQNHSYATGYVLDGMDATVFYGVLDFRFKNTTNYPIKIVTESYDSGGIRRLKVTLLGTNEDGRYAVPTNKVYDEVQPTKSYVADESVPRGTLVLDEKQNAYRGRKAQVTRTIYEADGTVVEQQDMGVSRYKMRPHLYHYNPLDGDPATWPNGVPPQPVTEPVIPAQPEPPAETTTPDTTVVPETAVSDTTAA